MSLFTLCLSFTPYLSFHTIPSRLTFDTVVRAQLLMLLLISSPTIFSKSAMAVAVAVAVAAAARVMEVAGEGVGEGGVSGDVR